MADYISREAAVEWFAAFAHMGEDNIPTDTVISDLKHAIPAADVEPVRHGVWLLRHIGAGHYWECSVCHTNPCIYVTEHTKFCPNCGGKMDLEDGNEQP